MRMERMVAKMEGLEEAPVVDDDEHGQRCTLDFGSW
jgi:hypothetical protein